MIFLAILVFFSLVSISGILEVDDSPLKEFGITGNVIADPLNPVTVSELENGVNVDSGVNSLVWPEELSSVPVEIGFSSVLVYFSAGLF